MASAVVDTDLITRQFKALSDPHRLRIIDRLRSGERCVCDLVNVIDAGQSLLSFHLKTLKEAGLVRDRREGRWAYYALNPEALRDLEGFVGELARRVPDARWQACCG